MSELRAYMVYDRLGGSEDVAVLAFARNAKEARALGYATLVGYCSDYQWVDVATRWLRSGAPYYRDVSKAGPYIVEPHCCEVCERWYEAGLDENGVCEDCAEFSGEDDEAALLSPAPEPERSYEGEEMTE